MRLFALLSWFDEPCDSLTQAVQDAIRCGATDVLALDGRYRDYPGTEWTSPPEQVHAIQAACGKRNVNCVLDQIENATEVEKRSRLFNMLYENGATSEDWLLVQDADHRIARARDLKPILEDATGDCFNVYGVEGDTGRFNEQTFGKWVRLVLRCVPGLHVHPDAHWIYQDADQRILWGFNAIPADDDLPIVIYNRSHDRDRARIAERDRYYHARAERGIETYWTPSTCLHCDRPPVLPPINADITVGLRPDGTYGYASRRTLYLCPAHRVEQQAENHAELRRELFRFERDHPSAFYQAWPQIKALIAEDNGNPKPVFS